MRIVKYLNNKSVKIEFIETGEQQWVRYIQFAQGSPRADLLKYPSLTECSFKQAKWITIGGIVLLVGAIFAIIYALVK